MCFDSLALFKRNLSASNPLFELVGIGVGKSKSPRDATAFLNEAAALEVISVHQKSRRKIDKGGNTIRLFFDDAANLQFSIAKLKPIAHIRLQSIKQTLFEPYSATTEL